MQKTTFMLKFFEKRNVVPIVRTIYINIGACSAEHKMRINVQHLFCRSIRNFRRLRCRLSQFYFSHGIDRAYVFMLSNLALAVERNEDERMDDASAKGYA